MEQDCTIDAVRSGIAAAVGWMYQEACHLADEGKDIRQMEAPAFLERALRDLTATSVAAKHVAAKQDFGARLTCANRVTASDA